LAHRGDRGPIAFRIEGMAAVVGAHVDVQHARTSASTARRVIGDFGGRDRQVGMVRLGPARAVRRHHDHERSHVVD
jgi:hypothetical protein